MPLIDYLINKTYIYQIGDGRSDYMIVPKADMSNGLSKPTKTQYGETANFDGAYRLNSNRKNNLGSVENNLSFLIGNDGLFDIGYVKKVFHQPPQRVFHFVRDVNGDVKMFFNPTVDVINQPQQKEDPNAEKGQTLEKLGATLKYLISYLFECKPGIACFDYTAFSIAQLLYGNAGLTYGGGATYGSADVLATVLLSSLTLAQKQEFFTTCESTKALVYVDKFFDPTQSPSIEAGQEVISRTLTNNLVNDGETTEIYKDSTADNHIYIIEITGVMNQNEWVEIQNLSNQSTIRFTWASITPSPSVLYYKSHFGKLYNSINAQIPDLNYRKTQPSQPNFLYFSAMKTNNQTIMSTKQTVRVQKNSINNLTIKIENLNTYEM
jgi:hypothetical protein